MTHLGDDMPALPDEERKRIERKMLEAAWGPLSKIAYEAETPSKTVVDALAESALAAEAAFEEARARLRGIHDFFYIDTDGIVCSAFAAWCAMDDSVAGWEPFSVGGGKISAFAMFVQLSTTLARVEDIVAEIDSEEPVPLRGSKYIKGWAK